MDWRGAWTQERAFWKRHNGDRAKGKLDKADGARAASLRLMQRAFGVTDIKQAVLPEPRVDVSVHGKDSRAHMVYGLWPMGDDYVTMGETHHFHKSLTGLQSGNPRLLLTIMLLPNHQDGWTDRWLHMRFEEQKVHGEWFRIEGELERWLAGAIETAIARGQTGKL